MKKTELGRAHVGVTRWRRFRASIDWVLVITIAIICAVGLLNLYSATHGTIHAGKFDRQVKFMIVGVVAFVYVTMVDYRSLVRVAWWGLVAAMLLLLVVFVMSKVRPGLRVNDSARWLKISSLGGQPSEFAKIAVILVLARMFSDTEGAALPPKQIAIRLAGLFAPVLMIAVQPDLGTATLVVLIIATVAYFGLRDLKPALIATGIGLLGIPLLWENMHNYQKDRVLAFLDPSADPMGTGWHTRQSVFSVGSGQTTGKGWMEGTQNQFNFLPEHWTDFPFSVWAEEWGFVGSAALLVVFAFLIIWLVNIALAARDRAGAIICLGAAALMFWHVVVNVAMVLGAAPVVGVTLPFISYGGSSILTCFVAMGLAANVSLRRHGY